MKREAIILAGGFGTRLRETVPNLPKCLAPVSGKPFLYYVINYLLNSGVDRIIFSLYYKSDLVIEYLFRNWSHINYDFVIEKEPLGTGGAFLLALKKVKSKNVILINGDSLFKIDLKRLFEFHITNSAEFSIALKKMDSINRYGTVEVDSGGKILAFNEKSNSYNEGLINGGIYIINTKEFKKNQLKLAFSLELDYLMINTSQKNIFGKVFEDYFIDIGVPADYKKANNDL